MFNEVVPAPPAGYHAELEELARVQVLPGEGRTVESYQYLLKTRHRDDEDGLTYEVTRLAVSREGWIVGYRSLVTPAGVVSREEKVPVHIADIHRMTADLRPGATSEPRPDGGEGPRKRARDPSQVGQPVDLTEHNNGNGT